MPAGMLDIVKRAELMKYIRSGRENFYRVGAEIYRFAPAPGAGLITSFDEPDFIVGRDAAELSTIPRVQDRYAPSPELEAPQPRTVVYKFHDFRAKYGFLWRDQLDDRWNRYRRIASSLGRAAEYSLELYMHDLFNDPTNPAKAVGWDGQPLASDNHQVLSGATYSNYTVYAPPSEALLELAFNYFDTVPDDHGRPSKVARFAIVCHVSDARKWQQILNSRTALVNAQVPGSSGGNNVNPNANIPNRFIMEAGNVTVIPTPYLQPGRTVFVGEGHELFFAFRFRPRVDTFQTDDPPAVWYRIWYSARYGFSDARRVLVVQTP